MHSSSSSTRTPTYHQISNIPSPSHQPPIYSPYFYTKLLPGASLDSQLSFTRPQVPSPLISSRHFTQASSCWARLLVARKKKELQKHPECSSNSLLFEKKYAAKSLHIHIPMLARCRRMLDERRYYVPPVTFHFLVSYS